MGLVDRIRRLRIRAKRAWRAWRGSPPRFRHFDDLDDDEQAKIKRQMRLTWEQMSDEVRQGLMDKLVEDTEEQTDELNESFRGGNGGTEE